MAKGVLYVRSLYPGDIAVQEKKAFEVTVDGRLGIVCVNRHLIALTIKDFNNAIEYIDEGDKQLPQLKVPITTIGENIVALDGTASRLLCLVDYTRRDYRQFSGQAFSEVLVSFDLDDTRIIGDDEFAFHDRTLQAFVRVYRHVSRDVSVLMPDRLLRDVPIGMVCAVPYSEEELGLTPKERLLRPRVLQFGVKRMSTAEFAKYLPKLAPQTMKNTSAMEARFRRGVLYDESLDGLLRALEELSIEESPKWALLEAFTVVELVTARFVNDAKLAKGVSKNKLDMYRKDIGISYMLNVDLPLLLAPLTEGEKKVIQRANTLGGRRNKVVHEGAVVSKDEAREAINAAYELLELLRHRIGPAQ